MTKITNILPELTLSRWFVDIDGYIKPGIFYAKTAGHALASAWRTYPVDMPYKDFMKIASCKKDRNPPEGFGDLIDTEHGLVYYMGRDSQYVRGCRPGDEYVVLLHPLDVYDWNYRPTAYRINPHQPTTVKKHTFWQRIKQYLKEILL